MFETQPALRIVCCFERGKTLILPAKYIFKHRNSAPVIERRLEDLGVLLNIVMAV
jgi:hypothetical protein